MDTPAQSEPVSPDTAPDAAFDNIDTSKLMALTLENDVSAFPLLKYFEEERERAAKKQQTFVYLFAGALVVIVAVIATVGAVFYKSMSKRDALIDRQIEIIVNRANELSGANTAGAPDPFTKEVSEALAVFAREMNEMKSSIARDSAAREAAAKAVAAKAAAEKTAAEKTASAKPPPTQTAARATTTTRPPATRPPANSTAATANPQPSKMAVPPGQTASEIILQSDDGARFPWRILHPDPAAKRADR
ncbi:MAG: hypothetical protein FWG05_06115 [Kiritimatiellaeota bacterium]|nr:hypothetical protein [Kiritimatiellota bacterium]